ncbi:MAG: FtsX-like permease family protein [Actinomycetota bacterium]
MFHVKLWIRVPTRLLRLLGIFAAIAGAALVLGATSAAGPVFLSSAGNAALDGELATPGGEDLDVSVGTGLSEGDAGITANMYGNIDRLAFDQGNRALVEAASRIDPIADPVVTAISTSAGVGSIDGPRGRLLYRDGALRHIDVLQRAPGNGIFVPDTIAEPAGVAAGDEITLHLGEDRTVARVAGIYRDLASEPLSDYWKPMTFQIINPRALEVQPPPFLIAPKPLFFDLGRRLDDNAQYEWRFELTTTPTLPEGQRLRQQYVELSHLATDPTSGLRGAFEDLRVYAIGPNVRSLLPSFVARVEEIVASLDVSVRLITLAGQAAGLLGVGAAAAFAARKRRSEMRLLLAQGVGPGGQGARAAAEAILPVAAGTVAGWGGATMLVKALGPSTRISPGVVSGALASAGLAALVALVVFGIVTAVVARAQIQSSPGIIRKRIGGAPWEAAVLLLAGASLYETYAGRSALVESAGGPPQADLFVLAFPILFIAGIVGLAVRALRRLLPRLRAPGGSSVPIYLAARRLATASSMTLLLVAVSAIAVGVVVYAGSLVSSTQATVDAKALVATGSDVAISITATDEVPSDPRFSFTQVVRESGTVLPADTAIDILAVDPDTFAGAAFWDGRFSGASIQDLLGRLEAHEGSALPVIVAGEGFGGGEALFVDDREIAVDTVGDASTFPGMGFHRPILVTDIESLSGALGASASSFVNRQLWIEGDTEEILGYLESNALDRGAVRLADEIRDTSALRAVGWSFGLLEALGIVAGVLALAGILSYLAARQREKALSFGLARRMGLGRGDHRSAIFLELAGILLAAGLAGVLLALISVRLMLGQLDPLPEMAPGPLFEVPGIALAALLPILVLCSAAGAWQTQRLADRANMAEVMRVAG